MFLESLYNDNCTSATSLFCHKTKMYFEIADRYRSEDSVLSLVFENDLGSQFHVSFSFECHRLQSDLDT